MVKQLKKKGKKKKKLRSPKNSNITHGILSPLHHPLVPKHTQKKDAKRLLTLVSYNQIAEKFQSVFLVLRDCLSLHLNNNIGMVG